MTSIACPPSPHESYTVSKYSVGASNGGAESAIPSPSVSVQAFKSSGNASAISIVPSLSSSKSALLPVPSLSVSTHSLPSSGNTSIQSRYPSLSSSESKRTPSPPQLTVAVAVFSRLVSIYQLVADSSAPVRQSFAPLFIRSISISEPSEQIHFGTPVLLTP